MHFTAKQIHEFEKNKRKQELELEQEIYELEQEIEQLLRELNQVSERTIEDSYEEYRHEQYKETT